MSGKRIFELPLGYTLRTINEDDYDKGIFDVLSQLTLAPKISKEQFTLIINNQNIEYYVIVHVKSNKVVACANLYLEQKLIRGGGIVGHLEEVVVDYKHQGKALGVILCEKIKTRAKEVGCYKLIGYCKPSLLEYYKKIGFEGGSDCFSLYFDN